jgi:hypothetical protein
MTLRMRIREGPRGRTRIGTAHIVAVRAIGTIWTEV